MTGAPQINLFLFSFVCICCEVETKYYGLCPLWIQNRNRMSGLILLKGGKKVSEQARNLLSIIPRGGFSKKWSQLYILSDKVAVFVDLDSKFRFDP